MYRRVLVTGAGGFIGRQLCRHLVDRKLSVRAAVRQQSQLTATETWETGDLTSFLDWSELVRDVDVVVHLVARTHIADGWGTSDHELYRAVNVNVTHQLLDAAVREGVSRFLFVSSIKAIGNGHNREYSERTACHPEDSYGKSKLAAERTVQVICRDTGCDYTILRPPLVYGVGVGGNFLRLLQFVKQSIPFPVIANARSMIHVDNLVEAIHCCLTSSAARNQTYHLADEKPLSTTDVVRYMARGLERRPILLPIPQFFWSRLGHLIGKSGEMRRLTGSLTVSTDKIAREVGWRARVKTPDAIISTARSYALRPWQPNHTAQRSRKAA